MESMTVRTALYQGRNLLEVTVQSGQYQVVVVENIADLYSKREVILSTEFAQKPTTTQILTWLRDNRWFTFNNENDLITEALSLLP